MVVSNYTRVTVSVLMIFSIGCAALNGRNELSPVSSGMKNQSNVQLSSSRPLVSLKVDEYNENAAFCCFLDWGLSGWLSPKAEFPNATLFSLGTNSNVSISELVKLRPIVLLISSITCPAYDINVALVKNLELKYAGKIDFYTVYTRENHPGHKYQEHKTWKQKLEYAHQLKIEDGIKNMLVDDLNGTLHQLLGNFGNSVYLIGRDMKVAHWSVFTSPPRLQLAADRILSADGLAANAEFTGGSDVHPMIETAVHSSLDVQKTLKKMADREGGKKGKRAVVDKTKFTEDRQNTIKQFSTNEKRTQMYTEMSPKVRVSHRRLVEFFAGVKDQPEMNMKNYLGQYQNDFREVYKSRYKNWFKLNGAVADDSLVSEFFTKENPGE